jgi:hypothetical protein
VAHIWRHLGMKLMFEHNRSVEEIKIFGRWFESHF